MNKLFTIILFCLIIVGCTSYNSTVISKNEVEYDENLGYKINDINFPGQEFRYYILENFDLDNNEYLSNEEIINVKEIFTFSTFNNLKGINIFTNLISIRCSGVKIIDTINIPYLSSISFYGSDLNELFIQDNMCDKIEIDISGHSNKIDIYLDNFKGAFNLSDIGGDEIINEVFLYKNGKCVLYKPVYYRDDNHFVREYNQDGDEYKVKIGEQYYLGSGSNELEDGKLFEHEEGHLAYEYGNRGDKWYRIDYVYPTDKYLESLPSIPYASGLENMYIKYRVRVFEKTPYNID